MTYPPRTSACVAGVLMVACFSTGDLQAVPIQVDDFSAGNQDLNVDSSSPFASDTSAAASALGGSRRLTASLVSATGNGDLFAGLSGYAIFGASSTGVMNAEVEWQPGGVDLTSGGLNDTLFLDFVFVDPGAFSDTVAFDFLFTSTTGDTASISTLVSAIPFGGDSLVSLDLGAASLFPLTGNTAFTSTDTIRMNLALDAAADLVIDSIEVGPKSVPDGGSTLAMLGAVSALGFVARCGKRRGRR